MRPLSQNQLRLQNAANKCLSLSNSLTEELDQIKWKTDPKGNTSNTQRRLLGQTWKSLWRKSKMDKLQAEMTQIEQTMQTAILTDIWYDAISSDHDSFSVVVASESNPFIIAGRPKRLPLSKMQLFSKGWITDCSTSSISTPKATDNSQISSRMKRPLLEKRFDLKVPKQESMCRYSYKSTRQHEQPRSSARSFSTA